MVKNGWYFDHDEVELLLPRFTRVWGVLCKLFDLPEYPLVYRGVNIRDRYYVTFDWDDVLGEDWRQARGEEQKSNRRTMASVRRWGETYLTSSPLPNGLPITYYWSREDRWTINGKRCTYYSPVTSYLDLQWSRRGDREEIDAASTAIQEAYNNGQLPTPLTTASDRLVRNKSEIWENFTDEWLSGTDYLLSSSITVPSYGGASIDYYYNFSWHDVETGEYFVISKGRNEPKMGFFYYNNRESWIRAMGIGQTLKYLLLCRDRPVFKTLNYP